MTDQKLGLLLRLDGEVGGDVVLDRDARKERRHDPTHLERFGDKIGDVNEQRVAAHLCVAGGDRWG